MGKALSLLDVLDEYAALSGIKAVTYRGYTCAIRSFCAANNLADSWPIVELNPEHFMRWRKTVVNRQRLKPRSVMAYQTCLKTLFNYAVEQGYLPESPVPNMPYLKSVRQIRTIRNDDHIHALKYLRELEQAGSRAFAPQHFWIEVIHALSALPIRNGQLMNIRWRDINFYRSELFLPGDVHGAKGGTDRTLPIPAHYLERLKVYKARYQQKMEACGFGNINGAYAFHLWFWKHCTRPHKPDVMYRLPSFFHRLSKRTGIQLNAHRFRHSIATRMCEQGTPLNVIQDILGHSDITTTTVYLHNSVDSLKEHLERGKLLEEAD